jgi:hypothetical protein
MSLPRTLPAVQLSVIGQAAMAVQRLNARLEQQLQMQVQT